MSSLLKKLGSHDHEKEEKEKESQTQSGKQSNEGESNEPDPSVEKSAHMTHDGAPGSHSALFGLGQKEGKEQGNAGSGLGSSVEGTSGKPGVSNTGSKIENTAASTTPAGQKEESSTGPMSDGSTDNAPPGAGASLAPSQGSGKISEK